MGSFILLFLYSTVQKSAVQYSYWPAPSSIHRGLEWSQCLNSVSVCSLFVCKQIFSFSHFHPPLFIQYSTEECSTVQLLASSLDYPERIRVVSVFEPLVCLSVLCLSANFLIFPSFILLFLYSTVQKSAVQYSYLFIKL